MKKRGRTTHKFLKKRKTIKELLENRGQVENRGQAAMEFLINYGWVIIVVLVVIAALSYFGILSPSTFMPEKCVVATGISCADYVVGNDGIQLNLQNNAGKDMVINEIIFVSDAFSGECSTGRIPITDGLLKNGETKAFAAVEADCIAIKTNKNKYDIQIEYSWIDSSTITHSFDGELFSRVEADAVIGDFGDGSGYVGLYAADCKKTKEACPTCSDGVYTIDIDGVGGKNPFEVFCDMTTDGGGWTLAVVCRPEGNPNYPLYYGSVPFSRCWNTGKIGDVLNPASATTTKLSDDIIRTVLSNGDKITRANWQQRYRYDRDDPTNHMVYNLLSNPNQWSSNDCGSQGKEFYYKRSYAHAWGSPKYSEGTGCSCAVNGWSNAQKDSCGLGAWYAGCERAPSASHCCGCATYDERADIVLYIR